MDVRVGMLNRYVTGWMGYFRLTDAPKVFPRVGQLVPSPLASDPLEGRGRDSRPAGQPCAGCRSGFDHRRTEALRVLPYAPPEKMPGNRTISAAVRPRLSRRGRAISVRRRGQAGQDRVGVNLVSKHARDRVLMQDRSAPSSARPIETSRSFVASRATTLSSVGWTRHLFRSGLWRQDSRRPWAGVDDHTHSPVSAEVWAGGRMRGGPSWTMIVRRSKRPISSSLSWIPART
jgi:hypothetical protein